MSKNVLIIDDDPTLAGLLKEYLDNKGFQVTYESNGTKISKMIKTNKFDLVFMDYRMEPFTGKDLLEWFDHHHPEIPIVMMSGYHSPEGEREMKKLGALAYLGKPLNLSQVDQVLQEAL